MKEDCNLCSDGIQVVLYTVEQGLNRVGSAEEVYQLLATIVFQIETQIWRDLLLLC